MEITIDQSFRKFSDLWTVFETWYFNDSEFDASTKIPDNLRYYKHLVGHEQGFFEQELDLLKKFQDYVEDNPNEKVRTWNIENKNDLAKNLLNDTQEDLRSIKDHQELYFTAIERYEKALKTFISARKGNYFIDEPAELKKDKRKSEKAPTREEKLRALSEFAPELIKSLEKCDKETKGEILFLITGVNPIDAYQMLFTKRVTSLNKVEITKLEFYKELLGLNEK